MFEALFVIGSIIFTEIVRATTVEVIRNWTNFRRQNNTANTNAQRASRSSRTKSQEVKQDLETVDVEFIDLERKEKRDGRVSTKDQERKQELELLRNEKFKEYQDLKSAEIAEEQIAKPEDYATSVINNDKAHILQFHMGQVVLEKKCSCGQPMILQSKQRLDGSLYQLSDFFWSCISYYNDLTPNCKTQNFTAKDLGLLHKANIFEFQISNRELSKIFHQPSVETAIVKRVKSHLQEKDDEVMCPVHHLPMILREKQDHKGAALDMFYLACPHNPGRDYHASCPQKVKLKSPAQLAAYLTRKEERGIL
ncbi:MAG: hypothetical protein DCF22_13570 [Leptolyngbya sp.]|nr:MAG: hypothetical protein DCF22_13570 [Leptolyngbya sp.]